LRNARIRAVFSSAARWRFTLARRVMTMAPAIVSNKASSSSILTLLPRLFD